MDIYVGNLPYSTTEAELGELFAAYGAVKRITIIMDRETGRSKGFGFVSLADESQVHAAIEAINGSDFGGRVLKANASEPKPRFNGPGEGGARPQGSGGRRDDFGGERQGGGNFGDDGPREKRGGKSKGSQRGKRRQKGGYDEGW